MIKLTAQIELLSGKDNKLYIDRAMAGTNISADLRSVANTRKKGSNPFMFGISKFGDGSTFSDKVDYFISSRQCNENGIFVEKPVINISADKPIESITIVFDKYNNRHPNTIICEYSNTKTQEIKDNDATFTFATTEKSSRITLYINDWNTPNYPLVIQGIYIGVKIDIDRHNVLSIKSNFVDRSNKTLPSYGIISNTGEIEFSDFDSEVQDYIKQQVLTDTAKTTIYLSNTLADKKQQVGSFDKSLWNYDANNRIVNVSLKDDLEEWQDINIKGINYDPRKPEHKSFKFIYNYLYGKTPAKYKMQKFSDLDGSTQGVLSRTKIKYPLLEDCTLWQAWTKLCETMQLHIYKDRNGITVCRYNGGN